MRGTANRARSLALLLAAPLLADAAALMHVKWEGLTVVVGNTVSIAMPGGAVIAGKATGVESDALVVVTEWQEFRTLDLASLAGRMATRILVDGRNLYTAEAAAAAGFDYTGIGRPARTRTADQREAGAAPPPGAARP